MWPSIAYKSSAQIPIPAYYRTHRLEATCGERPVVSKVELRRTKRRSQRMLGPIEPQTTIWGPDYLLNFLLSTVLIFREARRGPTIHS